MGIETILNTIVLIGAAVVAVWNILKFFSKPMSFFHRNQQRERREGINIILQEVLPSFLEEYKANMRAEYNIDRDEHLEKVKNEILTEVKSELDEIKTAGNKRSTDMELLHKQAIDVLRQKIEAIYHEYAVVQKFPRYVKENLEELYSDYTAGGGNHHIKKLYNRMCEWEVTNEAPWYDII